MIVFYKESKSNEKKFWRLGGDVARISDCFFVFFSKESKSEKKSFLFKGVKAREDWLV